MSEFGVIFDVEPPWSSILILQESIYPFCPKFSTFSTKLEFALLKLERLLGGQLLCRKIELIVLPSERWSITIDCCLAVEWWKTYILSQAIWICSALICEELPLRNKSDISSPFFGYIHCGEIGQHNDLVLAYNRLSLANERIKNSWSVFE